MTAAWTYVDPNTLLPGDPWTSAKAQAAFENVEAMAEGLDLTSPRILGNAAATIKEYAEANPFSALSAGAVTLGPDLFDGYTIDTTFVDISTPTGTYVTAGECEITSRANGTLRFNAVQNAVDGRTSEIRLLKNGTEVQSWTLSTSSSSFVYESRSVDVAADIGDVFEWQLRRAAGNGQLSISNISVSANDGLITVPLYIKQSEVR